MKPKTTATPANINSSRSANRKGRTILSLELIVSSIVFGILCFYAGLFVGSSSTSPNTSDSQRCWSESEVQNRVRREITSITTKLKEQQQNDLPGQQNHGVDTGQLSPFDDTAARFPPGVQDVVVGLSRVSRDEFAQIFPEIGGLPLDPTTSNNQEVVILYGSHSALPNNLMLAKEAVSQTSVPLISSTKEATENCDLLNIVLTDHSKRRRQCMALFGQYESFHLQKYMRLPESSGPLDPRLPLRFVSRGAQENGRMSHRAPTMDDAKAYWEILAKYLTTVESVLEELKPIAAPIAAKHQNTIIVLVCNFGQSELLLNFICAAKSRQLDLSAILVFATDEETKELAEGMGVTAFYDETNYGFLPKEAARRYSDRNFRAMVRLDISMLLAFNAVPYTY